MTIYTKFLTPPRDDQINKPDSSGCEIKYHELKAKIESFVAYLNEFKEEVKLDL